MSLKAFLKIIFISLSGCYRVSHYTLMTKIESLVMTSASWLLASCAVFRRKFWFRAFGHLFISLYLYNFSFSGLGRHSICLIVTNDY